MRKRSSIVLGTAVVLTAITAYTGWLGWPLPRQQFDWPRLMTEAVTNGECSNVEATFLPAVVYATDQAARFLEEESLVDRCAEFDTAVEDIILTDQFLSDRMQRAYEDPLSEVSNQRAELNWQTRLEVMRHRWFAVDGHYWRYIRSYVYEIRCARPLEYGRHSSEFFLAKGMAERGIDVRPSRAWQSRLEACRAAAQRWFEEVSAIELPDDADEHTRDSREALAEMYTWYW